MDNPFIKDNKNTDELDNSTKTPNTNMNIPIDMPFDENLHTFFENAHPIQMPEQPYNAGFWETGKASFVEQNEFAMAYRFLNNSSEIQNPFNESVNPNWSPTQDLSNFTGLNKKYWGRILSANGPQDQKRLYYLSLEQQQKEEFINNGSFLGNLIGGGSGALLGPSALIPIAGMAKYAKLSTSFLNNIAEAIPGISAQIATHNALDETTKIGGNIEDFAVDTMRDMLVATAFIGGAAGLSHSFDAAKIWEARKVFNLNHKGIGIDIVAQKDGTVIGYKANPGSNNLSAAEVDKAQEFLDSTMAKNGLFAIPYIGGWIGKGATTVNPIFRMIVSRFPTMRGFIDRIADHSITTIGNEKGIASPVKFENLMATLNSQNEDLFIQLDGLHKMRNGIEPGNNFFEKVAGDVNKLRQKWSNNKFITESEFGKEIRNVLINEIPSKHAVVNEGAALLRKSMDDVYKAFRQAYGLPETWMPPKTAEGYLMRVYDLDQLRARPDEWEDIVSTWLKDADKIIESKLQPIKELESNIKLTEDDHQQFIRGTNLSDDDIKQSADNLINMKKQLSRMKDELANELRDNKDLRIHIDDWNALSANESNELKKLLKPLNQFKLDLEKQQKIVTDLKKKRGRFNQSAKKGKTVETAKKHAVNADKLEKTIKIEEDKLHDLKDKIQIEDDRLQEMADNKEIDPILYERIPGSRRVKFKDTNNLLKFRETYASDNARISAARAYSDTILNQTAEDTIGQIMGRLSGLIKENPLGERTLLLPDNVFYDSKFMNNNIAINVMNYRKMLGRRTFLKQVFSDVTLDGGIEQLAERLNKDFKKELNNFKEELIKIKNLITDAKKQKQLDKVKKYEKELTKIEKEIKKLNKDFNTSKEDMNHAYEKMMGRTRGSQKMRQFSNITRSFAAATKLGGVFLTQITDLMAIVYKHGFWPFIADGLVPMLKDLSNIMKKGDQRAYRENATHAHLALNHVLSARSDRNWNGVAQPYEPTAGNIANGMEKIAHYASNFALTNHTENFLQRISANIIQSKIMRYLKDFKAGKLKARDKRKLLVYGLDPEKWADRFIDEWKARGSDGNGMGAYQSRYWEWKDLEASNLMSQTIMRGVKDTIIRRGMFDAPFFMDDPIAGMILTFKGWTAASLTRYLIPLMQQPDAEKALGIILMLTAGGLVDPLRRITRGEEPFQDDDNLFYQAIFNSGIFSSLTDTIEDINILTGNTFLKNIKNDRYRDRTFLGTISGPVGGIAEDIYRVAGMASTGNYNQQEVNKMARLIPGMNIWYLRGLQNKFVESLDLPKNRKQAERQNQ